jgi:hypothetical protein
MDNIEKNGNKVRIRAHCIEATAMQTMTLTLAMHHLPHRFWPGTYH